ncbi:MAG: Sortase, acyltransferase family [Candidatus Methanohalarchaeum thermophilum]|uniref:Sortase, acyltransferase family n=1 Tax=Methanohalarchaeum thermophilum TaxID=1903181 RepID=A0A1Q6DSD8_METT1|nr:MAG: Sortase, acyltransferase family [Candidatus Methanohalarchaeum thermophilum]
MFSGSVVDKFTVSEVGEVVLRYLEMSDASDLQELMNALIEEGAEFRYQEKMSFEEQIDWTAEALKDVEKGERVQLVVDVDDRVMGSLSVVRGEEAKSHLGEVGILLREGIRGRGIGEYSLRRLIEEARQRLKLDILVLKVHETNEVAINLYNKLGFEKAGSIRDGVLQDGRYKDLIYMQRDLR